MHVWYVYTYIHTYICNEFLWFLKWHTHVCTCSTYYGVLQVTVSRDSSSSDYSLDAGALVLADQGL